MEGSDGRTEIEIAPGDSVSARFQAIAAAYPDREAIRSRGQVWHYRDLNRAANRVAHALARADARVALMFGHHAPVIAAILGVLKAGGCHVCLDPTFPRDRNAAILADSGARLILCDQAGLAAAAALAGRETRLLVYEDIPGGLPETDPDVAVRADMDLGIFYTSGSSGQPKGVLWRHDICLHRAAVDRLLSPVFPGDRLTLLTPLVFPAAISDLHWALLSGACLCLYDIRARGTAGLPDWLRAQAITCMRAPVALFRHFLELPTTDPALPALRRVVLSGDVLYDRDVARARRRLSDRVEIIHRYSMSEAGLVCLNRLTVTPGADAGAGAGAVPVGHAVPGKRVRLFDPDGAPLPANSGRVGEIGVASRYLAAGYPGRPELTRTRFVADPENPGSRLYLSGDLGRFRPDGGLELLGRGDRRTKIRGYRVELDAIEAALLALEGVDAAAVVTGPDASGENGLVAYVVAGRRHQPDAGDLRRRLAASLPDYMLPARFVFRDALPLTASGKIDRQALASPDEPAPMPTSPLSVAGPRGAVEARIAGIWREVLRLERIDREADFFSLGGHSLLAARVVARLDEAFRLSLPLAAFYQAPTIAGLATMVERGMAPPPARRSDPDLARCLSMLGVV